MEILRNPKTGETFRVLESTAEVFRFDFSLAPRAAIPGAHTHPQSEQRIEVTAGALHLRVAGRQRVVRPGEAIAVAPGTPHYQWNPGDEMVRAVEEYRPGGRLHAMFATFFRLAEDGLLSSRGRVVAPLVAAAFFAEFRSEVCASPRLFQWGLDALAPLARAVGAHHRVRRAAQEAAPR